MLLFFQYLDKYELAPVYTIEEFKHWFIPRPGIIDSYVVEVRMMYYITLLPWNNTLPSVTISCPDLHLQKDGKLTDFVSFYTLPSTVMHHPTHKSLKAAYSFYNVCTSNNMVDLMQDALIVAKNVSNSTHPKFPNLHLSVPQVSSHQLSNLRLPRL